MTSKVGLNETEYLDLVERIQKAMTIEPFRPDVTDVVVLIGTVQVLNREIERLETESERLRAALAKGRTLVNDMDELMPSEATEDAEGWINSYRIPVGPLHRILGWARGAW